MPEIFKFHVFIYLLWQQKFKLFQRIVDFRHNTSLHSRIVPCQKSKIICFGRFIRLFRWLKKSQVGMATCNLNLPETKGALAKKDRHSSDGFPFGSEKLICLRNNNYHFT